MRSSIPAGLLRVAAGAILFAACSSGCEATGRPVSAILAEAPAPASDAEVPPEPAGMDQAAALRRSAGCRVAPANTGALAKKTTKADGKSRTYHLSVPAGLVTGRLAPLVVVLHGAGDTAAEKMRDWFGVEGKMSGSLFVYPQALQRTRSDGSGGNTTRWDLAGTEDFALFDAILDEVAADYCVDRARVFVTGFSSGGNFSQQLACLRSKEVRALAVVAGPGPFVASCGGAVSAWMTHDTDDSTLPVKDARDSRDFWAAQDGCDSGTWGDVAGRPECKRNTSCGAGNALVYCETSGVGHDVPEFAVGAIAEFFKSRDK